VAFGLFSEGSSHAVSANTARASNTIDSFIVLFDQSPITLATVWNHEIALGINCKITFRICLIGKESSVPGSLLSALPLFALCNFSCYKYVQKIYRLPLARCFLPLLDQTYYVA